MASTVSIQTTITTTGNVNLKTAGNPSFAGSGITAKVNNAASVSASSSSSGGRVDARISLTSDTDLNVANASASASCTNSRCQSAFVSLRAAGSISVGTVRATGGTRVDHEEGATVTIEAGHSVNAKSPLNQVRGAEVVLSTALGSGGGIGSAASPVNVSFERRLSVVTNAESHFNLNGGMTKQTALTLGVAPAANYTATIARPEGRSVVAHVTDAGLTIDNPDPAISVSTVAVERTTPRNDVALRGASTQAIVRELNNLERTREHIQQPNGLQVRLKRSTQLCRAPAGNPGDVICELH
jgi:hypothetical protein